MISNTAQINTFTAGMNLDTDITVLPNNQYRYAENIRVLTNDQGTTSVILNLEGIFEYIMGNDATWANQEIIGLTTINDILAVITKEVQPEEDIAEDEVVNHIYRITGFNSARPTTEEVCKGKLNLSTRLSCTGVYENDENIKLYFTDGKSQMKVINLLENRYKGSVSNYFIDALGYIKNPGALDYIPEALLDPFTLNQITSGSLPAGIVWYCYQLFNKFGTASKLSPISNSFHLCASSSNLSTINYMGSYEGENSGKGVVMSVPLRVHDFNYCRIYRIISTSNNQIPLIYLIDEIDISKVIDTIKYVDRGSSFLSELSVDEFNNLANAQFITGTITNKDNRLFAGNVTDETWDCGDYDARAFRANAKGKIQIVDSANKTTTFELANCDSQLLKLDKGHDCINPYNLIKEYSTVTEDNAYVFGKENKLGGYGINIEYTFITTDLHLTNKLDASNGKATANPYNEVQSEYNIPFKLYEWSASTTTNDKRGQWTEISGATLGSLNDPSLGSRQHNYADPEVDSILEGYQRDEIYRFGIVFYNKKSVPSPVYWIGDIRMPHAGQVPPFEYKDSRLIAHPLGIKFKVKHIPEGAIAYEIVRCDRTEADRTVIIQCAATNVYKYLIQELGESVGHGVVDDTSLELRPFVIPDFCRTAKRTKDVTFNVANKNSFLEKLLLMLEELGLSGLNADATPNDAYLRLISPEICLQGDASEDLFKGGVYLDYVLTFVSMINATANNGNVNKKSSIAVGAYNGYALPFDFSNNTIIFGFARTNNLSVVDSNIQTEYDTDDYPLVHTLKYYNSFYDNSIVTQNSSTNAKPITIIDAEYPLDIPYNAFQDVSAYKINVGMATYTNYAHTQFKNVEGRTVLGAAGPCVIAQLESSNEYKTLIRYDLASTGNSSSKTGNGGVTIDKDYLATAIPYFNLKRSNAAQYGGNNHSSRLNSVYISIGEYTRVTGKDTPTEYTSYVFGGDVYLGMIDYPFTFVFQGNDIKTEDDNKIFVNAYMPFESSINMNLLMGDTFSNNRSVYMLLTPIQMGSYHIQDRPYFVYNPVYSALQSATIFTPELIYKSSLKHPNRIMVSQAKTNGEVIDSWTQFKVADYLDVDNKYGPITNLKEFRDSLIFWQRDAFGTALTNEQSLITDDNSNQLVLGSGTLLSRYDYITNTHGDNIMNDKSIIVTPGKLYWYDSLHNELIGYDGSLHSMGKELFTQTYLNDLNDKYKLDVVSTYDFKYNEVWFNFKDKVLVFNELLNKFTSFYTYNYDWSFTLSDRSILIDSENKYHLINNYGLTELNKTEVPAKIEIVINSDYPATKVFDNVRFQGNFGYATEIGENHEVFENITFFTKALTAIMKRKNGDRSIPMLDYREDTYRFALPRAMVEDYETQLSLAPRLRGKWLRCVYEFNKDSGATFELPQITTTFRKSLI